jgi:hypothetical protein
MPRYTFNGTTCGPDNDNLTPEGLVIRPAVGCERNRVAWINRLSTSGNGPASQPFCAVWGKDWAQAEARALWICRLLHTFEGE